MLDHTLKMGLDDNRHLVVGDIHGYYDEFVQLLDKVNYDPARDCIYCVGDLIDRGPKSVEILSLFQNPGFYAVKGNHEVMLLDSEWYDTWFNNGGYECLKSCENSDIDIQWVKDQVRDLPLVIDIGEEDDEHAFRIVHAEMPPGWSESFWKTTLDTAINLNDITLSRIFWSRKLINIAWSNVNNGHPAEMGIVFHEERFRKVFTGHTPIPKVFTCGDHVFLDTGMHAGLSMVDAITGQVYNVSIENYNRD